MAKQFNAPGMTKWTNPLGRPTAKLHLYKHPPVIIPHPSGAGPGRVQDSGFLDVEIAPGEDVYLPVAFDDAICRKGEDGVVQSGSCPWLIKNDEAPELHPSLDPVEQQRVQAALDAEAARLKKAEAEAEGLAAEQAGKEAARLKAEADKLASDQAAAQKAREEAEAILADAKRIKAEAEKAQEAAAKAKAEAAKTQAAADKALEAATAPSGDANGEGGSGKSKPSGK